MDQAEIQEWLKHKHRTPKRIVKDKPIKFIAPSYEDHIDAFENAKQELGEELYNKVFTKKFGIPVLNFAKTLVINMPGSCYANCWYCIDLALRRQAIEENAFLDILAKVIKEFPDIKEVAITGGSLTAHSFNKMLFMLRTFYPKAKITWNTNAPKIDESYQPGIDLINAINLHRNAVDDDANSKIFESEVPITSIAKMKKLCGDKLWLRITIDKHFDFDAWLSLGLPLYVNRMLPVTKETDEKYHELLNRLDNIQDDQKRRNHYLTTTYNNIPIRICVGDKESNHVKNRYPTYLNVVILHRNGIVSGSWYYNDKRIL